MTALRFHRDARPSLASAPVLPMAPQDMAHTHSDLKRNKPLSMRAWMENRK